MPLGHGFLFHRTLLQVRETLQTKNGETVLCQFKYEGHPRKDSQYNQENFKDEEEYFQAKKGTMHQFHDS